MPSYQHHSFWRLLLRTLSPSSTSLAGSFMIALGVVGFHLLLLSSQADLFLPHVAGRSNDQLAKIYQSNILEPLNTLFGSGPLGVLSTAFLWGLVGWVIYAVLDFVVTTLQEWRRSEKDIAMPQTDRVVLHPLHNQMIIRILWRFLLGVIAIGLFIGLRPVVVNLFGHDVAFLRSSSGTDMLKHLGIVLGGWLLILHAYVVLFRLFVFRTRVFGEIISK